MYANDIYIFIQHIIHVMMYDNDNLFVQNIFKHNFNANETIGRNIKSIREYQSLLNNFSFRTHLMIKNHQTYHDTAPRMM